MTISADEEVTSVHMYAYLCIHICVCKCVCVYFYMYILMKKMMADFRIKYST